MPSNKLQRMMDWGVREAMGVYSGLEIIPQGGNGLTLRGDLAFDARVAGGHRIVDQYAVGIKVPEGFPQELPCVEELAGRIPNDFHTNPDGTLCLGSPVRLHLKLHSTPTLRGFIEGCLVPYLAGHSHYEQTGDMLFNELDHGAPGLINDYKQLLKVDSKKAVLDLMKLMTVRKRRANKVACPCGSGKRVGRCHHAVLNPLRHRLSRRWWRDEYRRWA